MLYDISMNPDEIQNRLLTEDLSQDEERELLFLTGRLFKNRKAQKKAIKEEMDRLGNEGQRCDDDMAFMKDILKKSMLDLGIKKLEDVTVKISCRKKPDCFKIENEKQVPQQFKKYTASFETNNIDTEDYKMLRKKYGTLFTSKIDKKSMNEWFKLTGEVPRGTIRVEDEKTIVIK